MRFGGLYNRGLGAFEICLIDQNSNHVKSVSDFRFWHDFAIRPEFAQFSFYGQFFFDDQGGFETGLGRHHAHNVRVRELRIDN